MKNKPNFVGVLLLILFAILPYSLMRILILLQKSILLLNYKDLILYTASNRGVLIIELLSIILLLIIAVGILYDMYLSKKTNKNYKQKSYYKSSNRLLKGATLLTFFIVLISGRCFTTITPDKIYYSSLDTLFLTKSYDYSEVKSIDIESRKKRKSGYILEYNISFGTHNVNLMNSLDKDKELKINKVHRNIIKNSEDIAINENLTYKPKKVLDKVSILTDLY